MNTSKAIYQLSHLCKQMDANGDEDASEALEMAVELMREKLRDEQKEAAMQHPFIGRKGRRMLPGGIYQSP